MPGARDPDSLAALAVGSLGGVLLLTAILASAALFGTAEDRRLDARTDLPTGAGVAALRAEQATRLAGYRRLPDGRLAIPIERAMDRVQVELAKPAPAPVPAAGDQAR